MAQRALHGMVPAMAALDLSIFRHPAFLRLWTTRAAYTLGWQVQTTALLWQTPHLAQAAGYSDRFAVLALGLVGLAQFLPLFALSFVGGQAADRADRKLILMICFALKLLIALGLLWATSTLSASPKLLLWLVFAAAGLSGAVNAFQPAAAQALLPTVIPRDLLPRAIALSSLAFTVASVAGPSLGGVLLAFGDGPDAGSQVAYSFAAALIGLGLLALSSLQTPKHERRETRGAVAMIAEGIAYVRDNKVVLGAISLDLVVVLLAGAQALIPVFATQVLHVGNTGYGLLRAALAIGAAVMALSLAVIPLRRHVGRWMFGATFVFALATIVFGLSTSYWLSFCALVVAGMADMISVQVRQSLIQLATPEAMLGRVAAVSFIFISASNELGDFEAGLTGALFGAQLGVALGGAAALAAAGLWIWLFPALAAADTYEDRFLEKSRAARPLGAPHNAPPTS